MTQDEILKRTQRWEIACPHCKEKLVVIGVRDELLRKLVTKWRTEHRTFMAKSRATLAQGLSNWQEGVADGYKWCADALEKLLEEAEENE